MKSRQVVAHVQVCEVNCCTLHARNGKDKCLAYLTRTQVHIPTRSPTHQCTNTRGGSSWPYNRGGILHTTTCSKELLWHPSPSPHQQAIHQSQRVGPSHPPHRDAAILHRQRPWEHKHKVHRQLPSQLPQLPAWLVSMVVLTQWVRHNLNIQGFANWLSQTAFDADSPLNL